MRKRYVTYRLSADEYQTLKAQADQAGVSVPVLARGLALESVQLAPRLEAIERLLKGIPERGAVITSFEKLAVRIAALQALAAKIDQATATKGATP